MSDTLEIIGNRIKRQRQYLNYSREKLAELADVSSKTIANIEDGKQEMGVTTILKLCKTLNISPNFLIFDKNEWGNHDLANLLENCPSSTMEYIKQMLLSSLEMYSSYDK